VAKVSNILFESTVLENAHLYLFEVFLKVQKLNVLPHAKDNKIITHLYWRPLP